MTPTLTDIPQLAGPAVRLLVPCPFCQALQTLIFTRLSWPDGYPERAAYQCIVCEEMIHARWKSWMLERMTLEPRPPRGGMPVCTNALYAPVGLGLSWGDLAAWYMQVHKDPALLKPFWVAVLGIAWEEREAGSVAGDLAKRPDDEPW